MMCNDSTPECQKAGPSTDTVCILGGMTIGFQLIVSVPQEISDGQDVNENWLELYFSWSGKAFNFEIAESDRYKSWKAVIEANF